jgi:hypothetical protein
MSDTDSGAIAEQAAKNVDAWIGQAPAPMGKPDNGAPGDGVQVADPAPTADPVNAPMQAEMVTRAATTLSDLGPEGQALVAEWGGHTSPDFQENLSYAKAAFRDIAATRPDLIAKVDASGLGNDPAVLKLLAQHGRMQANTLGDDTMQRNRSPFDAPLPRGNSAAQAEINKIMKENPPGSEGYKAKADRVMQLNEMIHGTDGIVGHGGRTV